MPATTKHVVVTGGVISGLGKGITAASLARLLTARGLRVAMAKMDPYLNIDPGTLAPAEHGETYVLDGDPAAGEPGAETDLDLGHYERLGGAVVTRASTITQGSVLWQVLTAERRGDYLGKTVQVVPHVVEAIRDRMLAVATPAADGAAPDVVILELGGTVGDLESLPFLEAIRRYRKAVGRGNFCLVHVALVPTASPSGEAKSKPVQHSVVELRSRGLTPDIVVCRSKEPVPASLRAKISNLCDVEPEAVISNHDVGSLYAAPLALHAEGFDDVVVDVLGLDAPAPDLTAWTELVHRAQFPSRRVRIGLVGKYELASDSYLSVVEALKHAGIAHDTGVDVVFVPAEDLEGGPAAVTAALTGLDAVVVPGGFGPRGVEGKVAAVRWTREHGVPTLGLCLGMQVMVIDVARHLAGLAGAHSSELDPATPHPVVSLLAEQAAVLAGEADMGGTMRLGSYPCALTPGSLAAACYGADLVTERHRHRYEVNSPAYGPALAGAGLLASGTSPDGTLVEMVELPGHPFWLGTQAHPELKSRPDAPHPLFAGLVAAALQRTEPRRAEERPPAA